MGPLGERVRELRAMAGLSRRELSAIAGVSEQHAAHVERGLIRNMGGDTLAGYSRALGCSMAYLATGAGTPPSIRRVRAAVAAARSKLAA
jgi:transcriptional regulator with XRE-family HTH domain